MAGENERLARLSIDIPAGLHRRIEIAAAARDLSVRGYVEGILSQALDPDSWNPVLVRRRLTPEEKERGLRALAEMERMGQELLQKRGGRPFPPSWDLLNEARDERTRELMGEEGQP